MGMSAVRDTSHGDSRAGEGGTVTTLQCISHIFKPGPPGMVPSGSTFQIFNIHKFPTAIIFDAVYTGAVLHHFGTQTLKDTITANWEDTYSRAMTVAPTDPKAAIESLRSQMQAQAVSGTAALALDEEAHDESHCELDILDVLTFVPYCMVPPDEQS
ncbi:hypothetical protein EDB86DRAFT_2831723 [Lactarius hatsudake]|nr:hypothetical protein EDB86DRAFT_2831723 [Lactarius hatsudake]